jgi:hypothetical protein
MLVYTVFSSCRAHLRALLGSVSFRPYQRRSDMGVEIDVALEHLQNSSLVVSRDVMALTADNGTEMGAHTEPLLSLYARSQHRLERLSSSLCPSVRNNSRPGERTFM